MTTAWIAGASGLVGGKLIHQLLADPYFTQIISVGRRTIPLEDAKLSQVIVDFAAAGSFEPLDAPDVAFSCLGTTIKRAGSNEAFRAVDYDAVLSFASAARRKGAKAFLHVSSIGAKTNSHVFYSSVKGEIEEAVATLGFPTVVALRPSILDGVREESRPMERIGLAAAHALGPLLGKYRPTSAEVVASKMVALAKNAAPGSQIVEGLEILK